MRFSMLVAVVAWIRYAASSPTVKPCNPANHICEGVCPKLPGWVQVPSPESSEGVCLQHSDTEACVCWLRNPTKDQHLKTLFKCDVIANNTVKHVMCVPPRICFPPGPEPGCLIVPHCQCAVHSGNRHRDKWYPVVAFIYRSNIFVSPIPNRASAEPPPPDEGTASGDSREFSMKHLLFLLAFVIAPLLCWCLLTFFHEGKCRKKRPGSETASSPVPFTEATEESPQTDSLLPSQPTAPKFESPPPYREAADHRESYVLEDDRGPPPSYEDVAREQWLVSNPEPDSD